MYRNTWKGAKVYVGRFFYCPVPSIILRTKPEPSLWPLPALHPHPPVPVPHLLPYYPFYSLWTPFILASGPLYLPRII